MTIRPLIVVTALTLASAATWAQTGTPRVDQRQSNQEQRIDQGIASGSLTAREAHRLTHQQNVIDKAENRAKSDGTVTRKERAGLNAMQNKASHQIRHQKHDRQNAGGN